MKKILVSVMGAAVLALAPAATFAASNAGYPNGAPIVASNNPTPAPGAQVVFTAQNFPPACPVTFTLGAATAMDDADANGVASAALTVPGTPGSYTGTAVCGTLVASFGVTVTAAPAPSNPGSPGTGLPATGTDTTNWSLTAGVLTLVGVAMVGVAALRRKPRLATN